MSEKYNFTATRLRSIEPTGKRSYYYDATQPGLRLAVSPTGNKSYQFQCWSKSLGRPVTRTVGKLETMSITDAREKAAELLADVNKGIDIESTRRSQREELFFSDVFDMYVEKHAKVHKSTWKKDEEAYRVHMKKPFGNKRIDWFSVNKVRAWHKQIGEKRGQIIANRALALLSSIFTYELPERDNPCRGVKRFRENSRDRFLQPDELRNFFESLASEPNRLLADFFIVLLLTGARKSNVCSMKWSEIDIVNGVWSIPAVKSKNNMSMQIPLVPDVVDILIRRKKSAKSTYVFPGRGKTGHLVEPKTGWKRIIDRAGLKNVRMHDLRRTLGSYMAGAGTSTLIIGKALGHKSQQSTAIYSRLNIDPVREAMLTATDAMLGKMS